ncbi:MAG: hypothetical protein CL940_12890 [Deltaproteobacteria bacterium]|nr:hypothetical protein [Deltaproteobacteria bacterium]
MRTLTTLLFLALLSLVVACADTGEAEVTALPIPAEDATTQEDTSDPDVTDSDATAGDTSGGDTATFEDDCGDGMICILGECKERSSATSCIVFGQCCDGDADDCAFGSDGCFCDESCLDSGDCCPDACAACGICNDDGKSIAPTCDECVDTACGDCAGCVPAVSPCDEEGEDCADEGATRCGEDESGHLIEVCTQLDACRRWVVDTYCADLNFCTEVPDVCVDGVCVADGDPAAACPTPDDPCVTATCDPGSGACAEEAVAEFAPCDDGSLCTVNEQCFNGECVGNNLGDVEGAKSTDYFTDSDVYYIDLEDIGTTDKLDGYACSEEGMNHSGSEFSIEVAHTYDFTDVSILVGLELQNAADVGSEYVDIAVLSKIPGTCWPDACLFGAWMDDQGRVDLALPVEEPNQTWTLVVDGRDGYEGPVRMAVSYWDSPVVESFCGNGEDDDGDGNVDCEDSDCFDSDLCGTETICDDGADNDADGFDDCSDVDCMDQPICLPEQDCEGDSDTDGDGLTGCDDPDCNGSGSCGEVVECADAIPISCFETLTNQTLVDGFNTFTGVEIPACGDAGKETFNTHKQLVYHVQLPEGCTGFGPKISPQQFQSVYAFGPDCAEGACDNAGYAGFGSGSAGAVFDSYLNEGWIVVAVPDGDSAAIANTPFEITLNCMCE